jgi:hypothetical protein
MLPWSSRIWLKKSAMSLATSHFNKACRPRVLYDAERVPNHLTHFDNKDAFCQYCCCLPDEATIFIAFISSRIIFRCFYRHSTEVCQNWILILADRGHGVCLGAFAKWRNSNISFFMYVCLSACNNSAPTGRILIKFGIRVFFGNMSRN